MQATKTKPKKRKVSKVSLLIKEFSKRVDNGAKYLNRAKPGWYRNIELDQLNLADASVCVLGQVYTHFWDKVVEEGQEKERGMMTKEESIARGFLLDSAKDGEYELLTRLWWLKIVGLRNKLEIN